MKRLILLALAIGPVVLAGCGAGNESFNTWLDECYAQGGTPQLTHYNDDGSKEYECFRDGVIIP